MRAKRKKTRTWEDEGGRLFSRGGNKAVREKKKEGKEKSDLENWRERGLSFGEQTECVKNYEGFWRKEILVCWDSGGGRRENQIFLREKTRTGKEKGRLLWRGRRKREEGVGIFLRVLGEKLERRGLGGFSPHQLAARSSSTTDKIALAAPLLQGISEHSRCCNPSSRNYLTLIFNWFQ